MSQKAIRPVTLRGSEQAENGSLACQQIDVLNSKLVLNLQQRSLIAYTIDAQLNCTQVKFSQFPTRENWP